MESNPWLLRGEAAAFDYPARPMPLPPSTPDHRKSVAEMCADWLREASVLVAVFGWLDKELRREPFSGAWAVEIVGAGLLLLALGLAVERLRPPK